MSNVARPLETSTVRPLSDRQIATLAERREAWTILDAANVFEPLAPINHLCPALDIAPGPPTLIAGYGYSGKTLAVQDFALAVATGDFAWGFPVRRGRVLHLDYEQGSHLTCLRYQRLARARGIDAVKLDGFLNVAVLPRRYLDSDAANELEALCSGVDLLIVDSFRAACPSTDENSSEARMPLDRLTRISEATRATCMVIHHARKPVKDSAGGSRMSIRGSGALYDAAGSVLVFGAEKGKPIRVEHEKAKNTGKTREDFGLWITDVEMGGDPAAGLRVSPVELGTDAGTPEARQAELKARILDLVRSEGVVGGVNGILDRLGGRKDTIRSAVAELKAAGRLKQGGTYHLPTLTLTGTDHAP